MQSVPRLHVENSDPGPPSLQTPLEAKVHVSVQVCALAKPTIWARKRMRASRGPKAHLTWTVLCSKAQTCSPSSASICRNLLCTFLRTILISLPFDFVRKNACQPQKCVHNG